MGINVKRLFVPAGAVIARRKAPGATCRAVKVLGDFVEGAKASGAVRRALDRARFTDAEVASPALFPDS